MPSRLRRSSSATACSPSRARRRPIRPTPADGFTLLEVLVALAILGIGLGVIFQGLAGSLRLRGESEGNVRCAIAAESLIGEIAGRKSAPDSPEEGEEGGCVWRVEPLGSQRSGDTGRPAAADGGGPALIVVRITLTAPTGRAWQMSTLLPSGEDPQ